MDVVGAELLVSVVVVCAGVVVCVPPFPAEVDGALVVFGLALFLLVGRFDCRAFPLFAVPARSWLLFCINCLRPHKIVG